MIDFNNIHMAKEENFPLISNILKIVDSNKLVEELNGIQVLLEEDRNENLTDRAQRYKVNAFCTLLLHGKEELMLINDVSLSGIRFTTNQAIYESIGEQKVQLKFSVPGSEVSEEINLGAKLVRHIAVEDEIIEVCFQFIYSNERQKTDFKYFIFKSLQNIQQEDYCLT